MHRETTTDVAAQAVRTTVLNGLCAGTSVMTLDGEIPVEHLNPGDRIITRDSGMAVLRALHMTETDMHPIRILAGSLGHTRPDRDMLVSPDTTVHIRDWRAQALFGTSSAMVPASRLLDGEFVAEQPKQTMRIFTLVFDRAHIIYADGLEIGIA